LVVAASWLSVMPFMPPKCCAFTMSGFAEPESNKLSQPSDKTA
jgi:hypothetical protein